MSLRVKPIIAQRKGYLANERKQSLARHINSISQISIEPVAKQARMNGTSVGVNPFKRKYDDPFQAMAAAAPLDQDQGLFSRQNINKMLDKGEEVVKNVGNVAIDYAKDAGSKVVSAFKKFANGFAGQIVRDPVQPEETEQPVHPKPYEQPDLPPPPKKTGFVPEQIVQDWEQPHQQQEHSSPPVIPVPLIPSEANTLEHDPATGLSHSNIPNKAPELTPLSERAVQEIQRLASSSVYAPPSPQKEKSSEAQDSTNSVDTSLSVNPSVEAEKANEEDYVKTWVDKQRAKKARAEAEKVRVEAEKASRAALKNVNLKEWEGDKVRMDRRKAREERERGEQEVWDHFPKYYEQATELTPFEQAELMKKEAKDRERFESRRIISESALSALEDKINWEQYRNPSDKFIAVDISPKNVSEATYQQIVAGIDFAHLRNKTSSLKPLDNEGYIRFLDTGTRQVYVSPTSLFDFKTLMTLPSFKQRYKAGRIRFF